MRKFGANYHWLSPMNLLTVLLQAAPTEAVEEAGEVSLNFVEMAFKGGWIMAILLVLSIIAIYIFFERFVAIRKAAKTDVNFMNRIREYIHDGKVDSAISLCRSENTPVARMIEKGIQRIGRPLPDVNAAIENVGNLEVSNYKDGQRNGETTWFDESGNKKMTINYKDGQFDGKQETFYNDGSIKSEATYKNGKQQGKTKTYTQTQKAVSDTKSQKNTNDTKPTNDVKKQKSANDTKPTNDSKNVNTKNVKKM